MEIRERGFGDLKRKRLVLSQYETFYLVEKGRIKVVEEKNKELSLHALVKKLAVGKPEIWIKYLVYRDLRDRGYIVREDSRFDFEIHGKGAERRFITIVYEGGEASLEELTKYVADALDERKDLILAVVDRRTDIVYYSVSPMKV